MSSIGNIVTTSPRGTDVSSTPVVRVLSSTIITGDLLSPTLANQASARAPKGKREKTGSEGHRSVGSRTQNGSSSASSNSANKTATLQQSLERLGKSDQSSDLGTEESRNFSSTASLPRSRTRPRDGKKRHSKESTNLSSERLSSDVTITVVHTHLISPGHPSDVRLRLAPTTTTTLPRSVSATRQATLEKSFSGNNDHAYAEDEDAYLLDGGSYTATPA
ncbi:hypothetical protein HPB51_015486 [Rhipicephalus microplus]|uniref:Uncharacterized protein n=1 Tax=Rhipicephalus microplus TaxID=6941 RepID=A0A9J6F4I6_RHIMP|nr:hypothetical protein HPB51_015486 [Rhipicephalus microplus]